jgi:hypothetical protein
VIVVIGAAGLRGEAPDGLAAGIALSAAASGSAVELITKVGDDPAGDALLLALAQARVGHVAVLRDPAFATGQRAPTDDVVPEEETPGASSPAAPTLEAADVGLALRYLSDYRVIVVVHPPTPALLAEATSAAGWSGAYLALVVGPGDDPPPDLPDDALVVAADPDADDADGLGERLGRYVAAVDRGDATREAFLGLVAAAGSASAAAGSGLGVEG